MQEWYAAIDLKSFYASVECVERGLNPLTTNLVVADPLRTEKTICLAVSPSLKAYGLSGRSRLFEVIEKAREVKARTGQELTYLTAPPRMQLYIEYATRIYGIYLRTIAPEDIHVYSIDEVFIRLTPYLDLYGMTPHEMVRVMARTVLEETGITATAGIGTNLYLAKIAMDIQAKHVQADSDGVRIAELDEQSYREQLWSYRPLTKFWRIGHGIARRLEKHGLYTMGDVARLSIDHEDILYKEFGVDAELLIDHAWGIETCTMEDIQHYQTQSSSLSEGQVLPRAYDFASGRMVVREMAEQLSLTLLDKGLVTDGVFLYVGYDTSAVASPLAGEMDSDWYGLLAPKPAHGSMPLTDAGGARCQTNSARRLTAAILTLYDRLVNPELPVRRLSIGFPNVKPRGEEDDQRQLDLFSDPEALAQERAEARREEQVQRATLAIRQRFGKNALLKGTNFQENATARERNQQIGGHRTGD